MKTPLDDMPVRDISYDWYFKAYSVLRYSKRENGFIPLYEMLAFANNFDLIGTKEEFINVIRGFDIAENKFSEDKRKSEEKPKRKNR